MEHASFVTAGRYVMAVIRTDGSLWMWEIMPGAVWVNAQVASILEETDACKRRSKNGVDRPACLFVPYEYQGYLAEEPDVYTADHTYILTKDGDTYACGAGLEGKETFVPVKITEE